MDVEHARDDIRDNHHSVMATTRADGRPQLSPVAFVVDGDGFVVVSTRVLVRVESERAGPKRSG